MKAIQRIDHHKLKHKWEWHLRAYHVYQATHNTKVKAVCTLVSCSFQGEAWCLENGHEFIAFDYIDKQIIREEEERLNLKGAI